MQSYEDVMMLHKYTSTQVQKRAAREQSYKDVMMLPDVIPRATVTHIVHKEKDDDEPNFRQNFSQKRPRSFIQPPPTPPPTP